eukprot:161493_1
MLELFWLFQFISLSDANNAANAFKQIPVIEVDGLISIYNTTNGYSWTNPWNLTLIYSQNICMSNTTASTLEGVQCISINSTFSSISEINLSDRGLTGFLPNQIGNFELLSILVVSQNIELKGNIPLEICKLSQLRTFHINNASIKGTIPNCANQLKKLTDLEFIYMNLTGSLHILCNVTSLQQLKIYDNPLNGSIPQCMSALKYLKKIDLKWLPYMTGTIPNELCELEKLAKLSIQYLNLYGTIPQCLLNKSAITTFEVSGNYLTGTLSAIPENINNFQIAQNSLYGELPAVPHSATLGHFIVNNNNFNGDINNVFPHLNVLKNVEGFVIFNNDFSGDVSKILKYLLINTTKLGYIGMQNNKNLKGSIPDFKNQTHKYFWGHSSRNGAEAYFMIHNCDFYGSLPNNLQLQNLSYLTLYNNRLSCELPDNFIRSIDIKKLFEVTLPKTLFNINQINGKLP